MKNLELTQMENLHGGAGGAGFACGTAALGILTTVAAIASTATPVGFLAWGIAIGRAGLTRAAIGNCLYELNN